MRAIKVIRKTFFDFLQLGPMLQRERARASERLRRKTAWGTRKLSDMMRRASLSPAEQARREDNSRRWNQMCAHFMLAGVPADELRQRVNAELGLPHDYSPGRI